jgi:hypothetical protein
MNEGVPKQETNTEQTPLQMERKQGIQHAESIIEDIEGFEQMDSREQFASLAENLRKIEENGDNGDRFAAEYLAARMSMINYQEQEVEAKEQYQKLEDYYSKAA